MHSTTFNIAVELHVTIERLMRHREAVVECRRQGRKIRFTLGTETLDANLFSDDQLYEEYMANLDAAIAAHQAEFASL